MRIFSEKVLRKCSKHDLKIKLDMVKSSNELTCEEQKRNIELIELYLNDGVKYIRQDVAEDIKAGAADISDLTFK